MAFIHLPLLRRVLLRTVSLSLSRLLRGHFFPFQNGSQGSRTSSLIGINDPCFSRVQFQSVFYYPLADLFQRLLRFLMASTQDDEVVGVPDHFKAFSGYLPVQSIEVDI